MAFHHGPRVESATGGSISTISGYTVHTFNNVGVHTFIPTTTGNIEVLVVGAGGSSSPAGAGGGGSAVYHKFIPVVAGVAYTVSVGSTSTLFHPNFTTIAPAGGDGETNNPLGSSGGFSGPEGIQTDSVNQITYGFAGARGDIIRADGGTVTVDGVYNVHTFISGGGIFTCTAGPGLMDYLLVGSGGQHGSGVNFPGSVAPGSGGGGGGSVIYTANAPFLTSFRTSISHTLTVTSSGPRFGNTYNFRGLSAPGGGYGADYYPGRPGSFPRNSGESNPLGSGGGGSLDRPAGVGAGVTGLGFDGGTAANIPGGAGGGAGSPGSPVLTSQRALGVSYSITGTSRPYGAGGRPTSNIAPTSTPFPQVPVNIGQGGGSPSGPTVYGMFAGPGALIVRYYADGKKGGGGGSAGAAVTTMGGAGSIYKIDGTSKSYGGGGGYTLHPQSSPTDYGLGSYEGAGNPGIVIIRYLS